MDFLCVYSLAGRKQFFLLCILLFFSVRGRLHRGEMKFGKFGRAKKTREGKEREQKE